jgi:hypothetical protein
MKHRVARLSVSVGVLSQVRWAGDGVVTIILRRCGFDFNIRGALRGCPPHGWRSHPPYIEVEVDFNVLNLILKAFKDFKRF